MNLVLSDRGKNTMDHIRAVTDEMIRSERQMLAERALAVAQGGHELLLGHFAGIAAVALADRGGGGHGLARFRARQRESWLRAGQIGLSEVMKGDLPLERLGDNVLRFLAQYLDAQVGGGVHRREGTSFRRVAGLRDSRRGSRPGAARRRPGGAGGQGQRADSSSRRTAGLPARRVGHGQGGVRRAVDRSGEHRRRVYAVMELGFFGAAERGAAAAPRAGVGVDRRRHPRIQAIAFVSRSCCRRRSGRPRSCRRARRSCASTTRSWRSRAARCASRAHSSSRSRPSSSRSTRSSRSRRRRSSIRRTRSRESHAHLAAKSPGAAARQRVQERVPGQHESRAAHAAQLHVDPRQAPGRQQGGQPHRESGASTPRPSRRPARTCSTLINDVLDLSRIEAGKIDVAPETVSLAAIVESLTKMFQPRGGGERDCSSPR